ncbi:MAG TPA: ATP-binding protein [Candidatus Acidoferrum sp.]|nr:ATP-binding protein [Candidatus Acidoferrum sp.]
MASINRQLFAASPTLRVRDVTLSESDDLQRYREKLARIVLDEMYRFVGLLDTDGNVLEINRAALEGAGIRLEDIQGRPFWNARWWVVSNETQNLQRALVEQARAGQFVRRDIEIYGQAAGEETIIIDYSLEPVRGQDGRIVFLLAEGRNITEKKRAEAEIARKTEELQQLLNKVRELDRIKSDFFANVSHELRTPLALILGPAEAILADGDNLTDLQRRDVGIIQRNAATLLKHVNDLLDIAKLEAGRYTVDYARMDVARQLRTVAAHFDAMAPQRSLSYVVSAPETLQAEVDADKFDRIVLNLLSNAFKFTPAGGRIRCAIEAVTPDSFVVSVQDSGPGVKPELRTAIFERFQQGQSGVTREFGGTGLGLAIAKDFVELQGGTITVADAPGGGALFQVTMPRHAPEGAYVWEPEPSRASRPDALDYDALAYEDVSEPKDEDEYNAADGARSGKARVLVVEDNIEMRRFISRVLDEYRVTPAANGEEALAKALEDPPDMVVTDLMMPRMGGDRLVAEMRREPSLAHIPVVVLSAKADEDLRIKLLNESAQDYVVKPFSAQELRARVRNQVALKRMRDLLQRELESQSTDVDDLSRQLHDSRVALERSLEAQKKSAWLWRAVFDNSAVGIGLLDLDGKFLETNSGLQTMTGYNREQLSRISLTDMSPEEDRDAMAARIANLREGSHGDYPMDQRFRTRDGASLWATTGLSLIPGSDSRPSMLVSIVSDATARKRAEEEQKKLASVVESSSDFIGIATPEGRVLFVNAAGRKIVGAKDDQDFSGATIFDFVAEPDRDRFAHEALPRIWDEGHWEGETSFHNFVNGDVIPMWQHIFFIKEDAGSSIALATVSRDLSERKRAEEKLATAQAQLAHMARVTTMGELTAAIAHEVNQPLTAIVANASACMRWLSADPPNTGEARDAALRIAREGKRASDVIGGIRKLMKKGHTVMEPIELNDVVRQVLEMVRPQIAHHGISLVTELTGQLTVSGDAVQIQQVLLNLIVNAIDATAETHGPQPQIAIRSEARERVGMCVAVSDSGAGIDPAALDRLFTPFFTTKANGMGMGLAISNSIILSHGGRLWATPNKPRGATFELCLPARTSA